MRQRGSTRPSWALWLLLGLGGLDDGRPQDAGSSSARWLGAAGTAAQSTAVTGRWGQAGALLSPNEAPTFVVVSGKVPVSGQTIDSTPATASALALDLSEPISNLAAPPWSPFPSSGSAPIAANGALIPLSSHSGLFFGGDAASDPAIALPTGNDSSWLLTYPVSPNASPSWTHELASSWSMQPQRRESVFAVSASNGTVTRSWIYGGLRPDGSGTAYDELWELQTTINARGQVASSPTWGMWQGRGGPPAMYDGTAVLLPASSDSPTSLPCILLIGGVQSTQGGATSLSDLSTAWVFEPSDNLASGAWQKIKLANAPRDRRGHVAVPFGTGAIWIQGGRDLDGSTVYNDAAVLDVKGRRWTPTSSGQAVWGHSAVAVGETILLAFGYGQNAPVSPSLSVYAPGNDTWLDAYQPSYLLVIANPKAASSPAIASTTSLAVSNAGTVPTTPAVTEMSQPDYSPNLAPTPNPATPAVGAPATGDSPPQWTAPGVALPSSIPTEAPTSGSDGTSSGDNTDGNGGSTPKSVIAGAVVGSILGALVLGIGGVIAVKRHRDHSVYSRRAYTGDDHDDMYGPGGRGGLMQEHRFDGGFASSEAYNAGKELPDPVTARAGAGAGAFGAMAALLTPRKRHPANESPVRTRRLNMLDEEEAAADETWTDVVSARNKGWTRFDDDEDDHAASPALGEVGFMSLKGRGGLGVWDGFGGISRVGDTVRSSKSFLGGALGGFVGVAEKSDPRDERDDEDEKQAGTVYPSGDGEKKASSCLHEYGSVAPLEPQAAEEDPSLTPIAEWEEDDARFEEAGAGGPSTIESGDTYSAVSRTAASSETHRTQSTRRTSIEVSPTKNARIVRPFSPASASNASLYGSTFAAPQRFGTAAVVEADLSRALSGTSHISHRVLTRSNSSWWSRLNLQKNHHQAEVPTPTAAEAIRDPAPAPRMDAIAVTDPFSDPEHVSSEVLEPVPPPPQRRGRRDELDEHGRFATATERFARGVHDRSTSSTTSEATATSSVLEDRLRNMDVVQRVQSGGQSSAETTPTMGANQHGGFEPAAMEYTNYPFRDPTLPELTGAGGSDSRQRWPTRSATTPAPQRPNYVYQSPAKKIRVPTTVATIQPPTPVYAPPDSPRKRLAGPRPEPLSPAPSSTLALPRSNSVKDLIANIEKRASQPTNFASTAATPADKVPSRNKVVHGFAKKPKLYVANPDAI